MRQLDILDMTGYLCTDVQVLRTGLLSVRAKLSEVLREDACGDPRVGEALEIIEGVLKEYREVEAVRGVNA